MSFTKKRFVLTEGLHSEELRNEVLTWINSCPNNLPQGYLDEPGIKVFSTRSGDVHAYCQHDLLGKDIYIIQQMGDEPWQDVSAICVTAQLLKSKNARSVTAVVPVWKLGWHGKGGINNPDVMGSHCLTASMLISSGVDRLVTLTPLPEMFSTIYPLKVEVPDVSPTLIEETEIVKSIRTCIVADCIDTLPYAQFLGRKMGLPVSLCEVNGLGTLAMPAIMSRDILIVANRFDTNVTEIARVLREQNCACRIACYVPRINCFEELNESVFDKIYPFITLEKIDVSAVKRLPVDKIVAEWIVMDRLEKQ